MTGGHYPFVNRGDRRVGSWPGSMHRHYPRHDRRPPRPYTVESLDDFAVADFASADSLACAFRHLDRFGGGAPGVDGLTYADFSPTEMWDALRQLARSLRNLTYRPQPTRPVSVPKPSGGRRRLELPTVPDRVVARALLDTVQPHYYRVRRPWACPWSLLLEVERLIQNQMWFLSTAHDVRNCYPSLRIVDVLDAHRQHPHSPDLIRLVETVTRGHDGPDHTIGLTQGNPYSPLAAELTLRTLLDLPYETAGPSQPLLLRYVDNLTLLSRSVPEAQAATARIVNLLSPHGLELRDNDAHPVDLRDSRHPQQILGYRISWRRDHLQYQLPAEAYDNLESRLVDTHDTANPYTTAQAVMQGWLTAAGPTLGERQGSDTVSRIGRILRETEHREILPAWIRQQANQAWNHWCNYRNHWRNAPTPMGEDDPAHIPGNPCNHGAQGDHERNQVPWGCD